PGRAGMHAGPASPRGPAGTRAGSRPPHRRNRRGCRAGATRASGTRSVGASRGDEDEPAALVHDATVAELGAQLGCVEAALEDLPAGAVPEHPLLPASLRVAGPGPAPEDEQPRCHAPRLREEADPFRLLEVAVEVAREDAVEGAVREGERERVPED